MGILEERAWLARVRSPGGEVVGAAFAIDAEHLLTCGHVAQDGGAAAPGDVVSVEFPLLGAGSDAEVLAEGFRPAADSSGDIALLRLKTPPEGLRPVRLRSLGSLAGVSFAAYGFPDGYDDGLSTHGEVGFAAGLEWVQLEATSAFAIEPGFSGGAVWDVERDAVVAMMVTRDRGTAGRVAFALPVRIVERESPVVRAALPTPLELDGAAQTHWDFSARGVAGGEAGWLFTGRRRALSDLARWLAGDEAPPLRVVTGGPGSGKSALLARVVTTSDRRYRERMTGLSAEDPTIPPVGVVDVTFHAKGRTVVDFIAHVSELCELEARDTPELLGALDRREGRLVIVVDALEESTEPEPLASLLGEMAARGCRLLVACRPHLTGRLRDPEPLNLDVPPYLEAGDVERYVRARLGARAPADVAAEVAAAAAGNFLVAQLVADAIVTTGAVTRPFPTSVADAFEERLRALPDADTMRELLLGLAYALGDGLTDDLWLAAASALSRPYQPGDLRRLLAGPAGSFIVTSAHADGMRRHRLCHQALADTLVMQSDPGSDQRALWRTWTDQLPRSGDGRPRWTDAPRYLLEHAAEHAASAGALAGLAADNRYLLAGDLGRLSTQLAATSPPAAPEVRAVLGLASGLAQPLDREHRAGVLALVAHHVGLPSLAEALLGEADPALRPRWAHRLGPPHDVLTGHDGPVTAVAFGRARDRDIIASAGDDGTVRLWDAASGQQLGDPLIGHSDSVRSVAIGRAIVASAGDDKTVRVWDAVTRQPLGEPLTGHSDSVTAVAIGRVDDRDIIVSAGQDETLRLWDALTGQGIGDPVTSDWRSAVAIDRVGDTTIVASAGWLSGVRLWDPLTGQSTGPPSAPGAHGGSAVAIGHVGGRDIIVSGGEHGTAWVWDPLTGDAIGQPLTGHTEAITGVALGRAGDRDIVASAGADGTVRLWDAISGQGIGEPLTGHTGPVNAVAVGHAGDRAIVASAGDDRTLRLWNPIIGESVGRPLRGHSTTVSALAVGRAGDRDIIASAGSDATVRLWDPLTGQSIGPPLTGHEFNVFAVAVGRAGDQDVVVSAGGEDRTVRIWDALTGDSIGEPLTYFGPIVGSVAIGRAGDRDVIVTGDDYGAALWDPRTGEAIGKRLAIDIPAGAVAIGRAGDADIVVSGGVDGAVRLWDPLTGQGIGEALTGHDDMVWALAVGRAGDRDIVVSGGEDGTVRLWDPLTVQEIGPPLTGHTERVNAVAMGRDVIASAGSDGTVRFWDPGSGAVVDVVRTLGPVKGLAFGSDCAVLYIAVGTAVCALEMV